MPCAIDCRKHVRLPLASFAASMLFSSLEAGSSVLGAAHQSKTTVELLHHVTPLRRGSFPLSPTEWATEFAELLVEVAVAGWSRQCSQSVRSAVAVSVVHSHLLGR